MSKKPFQTNKQAERTLSCTLYQSLLRVRPWSRSSVRVRSGEAWRTRSSRVQIFGDVHLQTSLFLSPPQAKQQKEQRKIRVGSCRGWGRQVRVGKERLQTDPRISIMYWRTHQRAQNPQFSLLYQGAKRSLHTNHRPCSYPQVNGVQMRIEHIWSLVKHNLQRFYPDHRHRGMRSTCILATR